MKVRIVKLSLVATIVVAGGCMRSDFAVSQSDRQVLQRVNNSKVSDAREAKVPAIRPETRFAAGRLLEAQGRYAEAAAQFRRVVEEEPKFAEAHLHLGRLYSRAGDHENASRFLRRAVHLRPENPAYRNDLGYQYMLQGSWSDAENELRQALSLRGDFKRAAVNLGVCLGRQGKFDAALTQFRTALPEPDAWYNLGLMFRGQRQYAQAESAFRKALEFSPDLTAARTQIEQLETIARSTDPGERTDRETFGAGVEEERTDAVPFFDSDPIQGRGSAPSPETAPSTGGPASSAPGGAITAGDAAEFDEPWAAAPAVDLQFHQAPVERPAGSGLSKSDVFVQERIGQQQLADIRAERACLEWELLESEATAHEVTQRRAQERAALNHQDSQGWSGFGEAPLCLADSAWGMTWMEPICPATERSARFRKIDTLFFEKPAVSGHRADAVIHDPPRAPLDPETLAVLHAGHDVSTDPWAVANGIVESKPAMELSRRRPSLSSTVQFATYKGDDGQAGGERYDPALQIRICPPSGCDPTAPMMEESRRRWIEERASRDDLFSILLNEIRCQEEERGY